QSNQVLTVETDQGITGIGEGGAPDTVRPLAGLLIGEDATRIEHLWQLMYRGHFYPPGREQLHALGALDLALWDIRGKALNVPVPPRRGTPQLAHRRAGAFLRPGPGAVREPGRLPGPAPAGEGPDRRRRAVRRPLGRERARRAAPHRLLAGHDPKRGRLDGVQ